MLLRRAPAFFIAVGLACAGPLLSGAHAQSKPQKASKPTAPAAAPGLPPASSEQLAAAGMTHVGGYACEFSQTVDVAANAKNDGYVDVRFGKQNWVMKPVLSSTGALRLEDVRGHMLMLQIANKSMLMDVKAGRRVVDDCVHDKQRESNQAVQAGGGGGGVMSGTTAAPK
jgi:hypothetical protein